MRIIRATHLGMCFGVRDAIALALEHADAGPLTILGDLVHNPTVLSALDAKGIAVAQDVAHVTTPTVMVTAHGTSERSLARTRSLGLKVVEATCPLVRVAHRAVAALVHDGYHIVIVGQRDHVEVRGLTGDLDRFDVVLDDEDVLALQEHPRIGVAAQTTQSVEKVRHLVDLIRRRFPQSDVRFLDTVCKPTKDRQSAAIATARESDVVIVIGGRSSNNTRELVKTCARYCGRVHHVETDAEVRGEWFDAADVVGLTAGTSTPNDVIDRVEARIRLYADASASAWRDPEQPERGGADRFHVAINMDGNGRWALLQGRPREEGHVAGASAVRRTVESAPALGITTLTLYAFSSDNWRRPGGEVDNLMFLLQKYLDTECANLDERGVRFNVIGRRDRIPYSLRRSIEHVEERTKDGTSLHLRVAIDYSARDALVAAANRAAGEVLLTREAFEQSMYEAIHAPSGTRDVDLLIRTGGEKRLSDFLLWESAYAELYFTDVPWPDFAEADLASAVQAFAARHRRYGGILNAGPLQTHSHR